MAGLKAKDIKGMSKQDREKKIKELKLELVKSKANSAKNNNSRAKDIRKIIARILTINNLKEEKSSGKLNKK